MIRLNTDTVLRLHRKLSRETGGDEGIRDAALLESAIASAYQTFDGEELYPSVEEKAARLGYALISNHAFVDGNKRIGMLVLLAFLSVNGAPLPQKSGEIARVGLAVASGEMRYGDLLSWVHGLGDRPNGA